VSEATTAAQNLGFLTVLHETAGYVGGYLVVNTWGRPLEFRLSTAVQPNRVQQILYGGALQPYICAELIGKTLLEKSSVTPRLVITDRPAVLDLRFHVEIPVLLLQPADGPLASLGSMRAKCVRSAENGHAALFCHDRFPEDAAAARQIIERLDDSLELTEPFTRIREAISEARKMGVTNRG